MSEATSAEDGGDKKFSADEVSNIVRERVGDLNAMQQQIANLTAKLEGQQQQQQQQPTKVYTRQELETLVKDKKISAEQANSILERQAEQVTRNIASQEYQALSRQDRTQASIDKYVAFDPELMTPGSKSRERVNAEMQKHSKITGKAELTIADELLALNTIYGDEDRLATGEGHRQSHQETGGGGDGSGGEGDDGMPSDFTAKEKRYYQKQIDMGAMSLEDVKKLSEYRNADLSKRHA